MNYIDIHTHIDSPAPPACIAIHNVLAGEAAFEAEHIYNSLGIHPWQLMHASAKELEKNLSRAFQYQSLQP
jgi:Tat protein secretion system quality control protein TatD with DNase activity